MAKFIFVYKGQATDMNEMSIEESKAILDAWDQWMKKTGKFLVDIGQPMANGISVLDDGSEGTPALLNGYSIVEAGNIAGAKKLAEGYPFLSDGKGHFAIDIYELLPVPM